MAARPSRKRQYQVVYNGLKKIQRELNTLGIETTYKDRELLNPRFNIFYRPIYASNGETAFLLHVFADGVHYDHLDARRGLDYIKNEMKQTVPV